MQQVAFPIYVMQQLGVASLIVTNACGGINESFVPGDLMLIEDHINLLGRIPLIGPNDERFGPRFPDMSEVYSRRLMKHAEDMASQLCVPVQHGVYAIFPVPAMKQPPRSVHTRRLVQMPLECPQCQRLRRRSILAWKLWELHVLPTWQRVSQKQCTLTRRYFLLPMPAASAFALWLRRSSLIGRRKRLLQNCKAIAALIIHYY